MKDYPPLHSPEAFAAYREKFKNGVTVEPLVVIPASIVIEHLKQNQSRFSTYKQTLDKFVDHHPKAAFFMLGGKHRSAAATILGLKIPCIIAESDTDIDEIHTLMKKNEITGEPSVGQNLEETLAELDDHYFEYKDFWSMD